MVRQENVFLSSEMQSKNIWNARMSGTGFRILL